MVENDVARIKELIHIIRAGEYREEGYSFCPNDGGYVFTFSKEKRKEALKELKRIAKNSSKEIRTLISRETGLTLSISRKFLKYIQAGLIGLVIGAGAGKGCEIYSYHQKVEEAKRKVGSTISKEYNIIYTPQDVEWFKKKYQEKRFEKNAWYMGIGGLVGLVVGCLRSSIVEPERVLNKEPSSYQSKQSYF